MTVGLRLATERRLLHRATPLLVVALLGAAVWLLHRELRVFHYSDIRRSLAAISTAKLGLTILLTAISFWILTGGLADSCSTPVAFLWRFCIFIWIPGVAGTGWRKQRA
jgi:hypothetical protein